MSLSDLKEGTWQEGMWAPGVYDYVMVPAAVKLNMVPREIKLDFDKVLVNIDNQT